MSNFYYDDLAKILYFIGDSAYAKQKQFLARCSIFVLSSADHKYKYANHKIKPVPDYGTGLALVEWLKMVRPPTQS